MKLWLLQRKGFWFESHGQVWHAIVRAETEDDARKASGNFYLKEGYSIWLDPEQTMCTELTINGPYGDVFVFDTVANPAYGVRETDFIPFDWIDDGWMRIESDHIYHVAGTVYDVVEKDDIHGGYFVSKNRELSRD